MKTGIEKFFESYLKNIELENRKTVSYGDYILRYGNDPAPAYANTVRGALVDYERGRAGYGALGETVGQMGLSTSGYAERLDEIAAEKRDTTLKVADAVRTATERENRAGYRDYVEKVAEERTAAREDAIADIARLGLSDYERALEYAIGVGLSGEDAAIAAKVGADSVKAETREETLTRIVGYGFSYDTAYRYAIACGYDEDAAKKLAEAAESVRKEQAGSAVYPFY